MSSVVDQVLTIAAKLHQSGITPTTATVKAKLGAKVPIPVLIEGLTRFKSLSAEEIEALSATPKSPALSQPIDGSSAAAMTDDIDELKQQLQQLMQSQQQLEARVATLEALLTRAESESN
ncbi:hypothetical protein JYB87_12305 [Shewanella avicenniae]|uniref:KfrA N-terminal DNA-binding domain-containing protein n=1 Tax=Shewanella avicenniae TaxID=2814294 RepID=A0ABX7QP87_9GAMM|nr:hypothetical protein [Shewanella avicenniae]QSX32543.1 hypothetical protein JYB87_12305 [Shewanella avicenniae]